MFGKPLAAVRLRSQVRSIACEENQTLLNQQHKFCAMALIPDMQTDEFLAHSKHVRSERSFQQFGCFRTQFIDRWDQQFDVIKLVRLIIKRFPQCLSECHA